MFVAVFKQNLKQPIGGDGDHREHADYCSQRENHLQDPNEGVLQSFHRADYSLNVAGGELLVGETAIADIRRWLCDSA